MASEDDEIDRLYQLGLDEFTPARNALAKSRGKADPSIRQLQKPSVPAWAVNQLYWRERDVYDRLIDAAERLRDAHRKILAGTQADLREAETAHRDAVRAASDRARTLLAGGGQVATPATMTQVGETLSSLPGGDPPGRLVRPLKPMGFEALSGVAARPAAAPRPQLRIVEKKTPDDVKREAEAAKKLAAEREKQRQDEEREAEARRQKAQKELQAAAETVEKAQAAVKDAEERLDRLQKELREAQTAHRHAKLRAQSP